MKTMKTTAALVLAAVLALPALASDKALDEMLALRAPAGSPVKLGEWNGDLDACKKMADEYGCTVSEPDDSIREATIAAIQPMVEDWDVIQSYAE